jgi:hypothetical protein
LSITARDYYGCRNHVESGACANDLRIRRESIEEIVIRKLARHLPEYIELLCEAASRATVGHRDRKPVARERRLVQLRGRAERIMHAIQAGTLIGRALDEALGGISGFGTRSSNSSVRLMVPSTIRSAHPSSTIARSSSDSLHGCPTG